MKLLTMIVTKYKGILLLTLMLCFVERHLAIDDKIISTSKENSSVAGPPDNRRLRAPQIFNNVLKKINIMKKTSRNKKLVYNRNKQNTLKQLQLNDNYYDSIDNEKTSVNQQYIQSDATQPNRNKIVKIIKSNSHSADTNSTKVKIKNVRDDKGVSNKEIISNSKINSKNEIRHSKQSLSNQQADAYSSPQPTIYDMDNHHKNDTFSNCSCPNCPCPTCSTGQCVICSTSTVCTCPDCSCSRCSKGNCDICNQSNQCTCPNCLCLKCQSGQCNTCQSSYCTCRNCPCTACNSDQNDLNSLTCDSCKQPKLQQLLEQSQTVTIMGKRYTQYNIRTVLEIPFFAQYYVPSENIYKAITQETEESTGGESLSQSNVDGTRSQTEISEIESKPNIQPYQSYTDIIAERPSSSEQSENNNLQYLAPDELIQNESMPYEQLNQMSSAYPESRLIQNENQNYDQNNVNTTSNLIISEFPQIYPEQDNDELYTIDRTDREEQFEPTISPTEFPSQYVDINNQRSPSSYDIVELPPNENSKKKQGNSSMDVNVNIQIQEQRPPGRKDQQNIKKNHLKRRLQKINNRKGKHRRIRKQFMRQWSTENLNV